VRAILIDPDREDISEISLYLSPEYSDINATLDSDGFTIEPVFTFYSDFSERIGHMLYVDEEGLQKNRKHHFKFSPDKVGGDMQWLAGKGLIVKSRFDDNGMEEEVDHTMNLEELRKNVEWLHGDNPTELTFEVHAW
jgi:hypothetical protein